METDNIPVVNETPDWDPNAPLDPLPGDVVAVTKESPIKTNSTITHAIKGNVITFTALGAGSFEFDKTKCAEKLRDHAEDHGWVQRISDRAAKGRDPKTGKPASPADKLASMRELAEHYMSGTEAWSMVRVAAPPRELTAEEKRAKMLEYAKELGVEIPL